LIDLHTHVLPGLDDGVADAAAALALVRRSVAGGVSTIAATPHVREDYPTTPEQMEAALAALAAAASAVGLEVDLRGGAEIAVDRVRELSDEELGRFGLGGNPGVILLEFPYFGWSLGLGFACARLRRLGIVPVVAHPERNGEVQAQPRRLEELVTGGALVQLTTGSLAGAFGSRARTTALRLLDLRLAHLLATDSHGSSRDVGLSEARAELADDPLADWLADDVPRALLSGRPLPPRPRGEPRRHLSRLRTIFTERGRISGRH